MADYAQRNFAVRTTAGVLHSRHDTLEQAQAAAYEADSAAMKFSIATRYTAHDETP